MPTAKRKIESPDDDEKEGELERVKEHTMASPEFML
jgi:hypothetical protein